MFSALIAYAHHTHHYYWNMSRIATHRIATDVRRDVRRLSQPSAESLALELDLLAGSDNPVLACADNLDFMRGLPSESMKLIVTSPPYNIGKSYETKTSIDAYIESQRRVVSECVRLLHPNGSICWQVGNYVENGEIIPLDTILYPVFKEQGLKFRNRIIWHFGHGLHCSKRLSGRYETINWWTKSDEYTWDLDPIRVPSKYPGKRHFKGPNAGKRPHPAQHRPDARRKFLRRKRLGEIIVGARL